MAAYALQLRFEDLGPQSIELDDIFEVNGMSIYITLDFYLDHFCFLLLSLLYYCVVLFS
jgi:hypothetical protein